MGKAPSFRLKLALLMGGVTALLVLVPVSLLWSLTERGRMARLDRELHDLSKPNLQRANGRNHYQRFENGLALSGNGETIAFWVVDEWGETLHKMESWPAGLTRDRLPEPGPMKTKKPKLEKGSRDTADSLQVSEAGFLDAGTDGRSWRVSATSNDLETLYLAYDLSSLDGELAEERRRVFLIVPIALVVSAVLSWWLAGRAMKPVRRLSERLDGMGAKDLGERIDGTGEDREFRRLVEVFNGMMERLEKSFQQASRFSADASHELRTPLALMQSELEESLNQAADGSPEQRKQARLLDDVAGLRAITEKLLLLSKADAGEIQIARDRIDVTGLVEEMIEDLKLLDEGRRVSAEVRTGVEVTGDEILLRQVLQNLVSNAIRHGSPEGEIRVVLSKEGSEVFLKLSNDGPAIPKEARERIFDRFFRVNDARDRRSGGSGLGLALSREIARAHGGNIELLDTREVTFCLRLPLIAEK
ncbi:sensor histidine kinase [Haloferula chungangensis]|uniref:histidine kinase n=1 Tax=Haloferula chungangensis TaxID=1048331 RepID=A0ABW2L848_9BACT